MEEGGNSDLAPHSPSYLFLQNVSANGAGKPGKLPTVLFVYSPFAPGFSFYDTRRRTLKPSREGESEA